MSAAPAREVAQRVVVRVFEQEAYADRAFAAEAARLDERDRALAQRISYGTIQRVRTLDHGIETLGRRPVRKPIPRCVRRCRSRLPAGVPRRDPRRAAVHESVSSSRGRSRARSRVHERRGTPARGGAASSSPRCRTTPEEAALRHSIRTGSPTCGGGTSGPDEARALMQAQNEPTVVRVNARCARATWRPSRSRRPERPTRRAVDEAALEARLIFPQSVGSQLAGLAVAAEPVKRVLDHCAAPGARRFSWRNAPPRSWRSSSTRAAPAAGGEPRSARRDERPGRQRRALALPEDLAGFDQCSSTRRARASASSPAARICVGARRPLPELQAALLRVAAERARPGGTVVYSVCTINADESEAVVDASGLEPDDLGTSGPLSPCARPGSCRRCRTSTAPPGSSSRGQGRRIRA